MIARRIKPNIAIVTDVTHDTTTPMINKIVEGDISCGKGPALSYAPAVHNKLLAFVENISNKKKIPVQWRTLSRTTGTDTDSFAYANDGCPSVLISIPLRYMHTTVEMLHRDDIENTIRLMYETIIALTPKTNLSYL
jgi:putative aminopeptidase FrvX